MLFNDGIKQHWLCKIDELGDRFNPDCGNSPPSWEFGEASPLNLLTGIYDDVKWTDLCKEFQLPRWILECVDEHMHNVSPRTSHQDLKLVVESCQTYTDLEVLYWSFAKKIVLYMLENFSAVKAQLSEYYASPMWAHLVTHCQLCIDNNKDQNQSLNLDLSYIDMCKFEVWGDPSNKYLYFHHSLEWVKNKHTGGFVEMLYNLHKYTDNKNREEVGQIVYTMLVDTLKGA